MEKEFIRQDSSKLAEFLKGINDTIFRSNEVIRLFNENQSFKQIETTQELVSLLSDPVQFYDDILLRNIAHDDRLQVNMTALATLYNVPRDKYLIGLGMTPEQAATCRSCGGEKQALPEIKTLSIDQFNKFSRFLILKAGSLCRNENAIDKHIDSFNVYASTADQIAVLNHWNALVSILNEHSSRYRLGPQQTDQICKTLKLQQLDRKFIINDMALSEEIKYLK